MKHLVRRFSLPVLLLAIGVSLVIFGSNTREQGRKIDAIDTNLCAAGKARATLLKEIVLKLTEPNTPLPDASPDLVAQIARANAHKAEERTALLAMQGPDITC